MEMVWEVFRKTVGVFADELQESVGGEMWAFASRTRMLADELLKPGIRWLHVAVSTWNWQALTELHCKCNVHAECQIFKGLVR